MSNLSQPIWEMAVHLAVAGGVFDCVFLYYLFSHRPTVTPNKWLQRRNSGLSTPDYGIFIDSPLFQCHRVDSRKKTPLLKILG